MVRPARDTRNHILSAAYGLLYKEGFARVSMDAIAAAAAVTKRTLYYHFDSKDSLAAAVLDHQHRLALARIQGWRSPSAATPADFLAALFDQLQTWVSEPRWLGSGFTRLTMELADRPGHPARSAASRHKAAVESWLSDQLEGLAAPQPRMLARQVLLLIEGCMSLALIHGDKTYVSIAAQTAAHLATRGTD